MKEIITTAISGTQFAVSSFVEVAPFIIPSVHQSLAKFIYILPNILMKVGFLSCGSDVEALTTSEKEEIFVRK